MRYIRCSGCAVSRPVVAFFVFLIALMLPAALVDAIRLRAAASTVTIVIVLALLRSSTHSPQSLVAPLPPGGLTDKPPMVLDTR